MCVGVAVHVCIGGCMQVCMIMHTFVCLCMFELHKINKKKEGTEKYCFSVFLSISQVQSIFLSISQVQFAGNVSGIGWIL